MLFIFSFFIIYFPSLIFFPISVKIVPFISGIIIFSYGIKVKEIFSKFKISFKSIILLISLFITLICFIRYPNDRYLSTGVSIFLYLLFEGKKINLLFYRFWRETYIYKQKLFLSILFISTLILLGFLFNFSGLQIPFIDHNSNAIRYLDIGYRFPGFLGVIGSIGSIAYASYTFLILIFSQRFIGSEKLIIYLCSLLSLAATIMSGSSGLFFILIYLTLYLIKQIFKFLSKLKVSKNFLYFSTLIIIIFTIFITYLLNIGRQFGFRYIILIFKNPDELLTKGTSSYLYQGIFKLPNLIQEALTRLYDFGFDSILFGEKTINTLPLGQDYGYPNIILLYGLPLAILFSIFIIILLMNSLLTFLKYLDLNDQLSYLISLKLTVILFIIYYSYKEPAFFNTPCLFPLYYLVNSSIYFKLKNKNL